MIGELAGVIAPILLMAAIGYWIQKAGPNLETKSMSMLVMMVGTPALVFSSLTSTDLPETVLLQMSAGAICASVIAAVLATAFLMVSGFNLRSFLPSLTMPNSGNIGLPVVLLAFGNEGLAIGVAFFFVIAILQYTVMPIVTAGSFSLGRTLKEPLVWSVTAVLVVKATGITPPEVIRETTRLLGGMMIPVMVILLGAAIARLRIDDIKTAVALAAARLLIGIAAGTATIALLGATGLAAGSLFLMAAMPSAIVTYVFAERYERDPEKVAGLIVASTLLTFAVLPALLWIGLTIADRDAPMGTLLTNLFSAW
ncbi:AEC family transporter [uncultured Roseibium sp.]|uniref:AEC family transporter n=1 Tax=uncultured Roseibium sp. TaxID=1936171 RepID=UPI0026156BA0|nr:AEC family transporter [uncultured Roseibium sp.]